MSNLPNQSSANNPVHHNAVIFSNVIELATTCIKKVSVSNVADALSDTSLTTQVVNSMVAARLKDKLIVSKIGK